MIKKGDKVRYLNAVGGGTVVSVESKDVAVILEDDGFETPVLIRELVVIESVNRYNFPENTTEKTFVEELVEPSVEEKTESLFDLSDEIPEKEQLSVYLAFVPKNIKELQTTDYDCYLINDSNYYLQYNFFSGDGQLVFRENGELEPQTKIWMEEIDKLRLNDFTQVAFQAVAFKKGKTFDRKPVLDEVRKLNPVKLYKLHSFSENDFFTKPAMLVPFVEKDMTNQSLIPNKENSSKFLETDNPKQFKDVRKEQKKNSDLIEVDLHINALLDVTAGLSNIQLMQAQLRKFHEKMSEYRSKKGQKIVFIHGRGEGVLRKELERELRTTYKGCYFQDASFREYGFGATQVTIR